MALAPPPARAQGHGADGGLTPRPVRLFVDCRHRYCDADELRRQIDIVDHVRDVHDADVYAHALGEPTGSGTAVVLYLQGRGQLAGLADTLRLFVPANTPLAVGRARALQLLRAGLARYIVYTGGFERVTYRPASAVQEADGSDQTGRTPRTPSPDPWRGYVARLALSTSASGEQQVRSFDLGAGVSVSRVTATAKLRANARGGLYRQAYEIEGEPPIQDTRTSFGADGLLAWALTDRLSYGATGSVTHATFSNVALGADVSVAVEASLFPYAEAGRREVTLLYEAGGAVRDYEEETVFFQTAEAYPTHALVGRVGYEEAWGSAGATLEARQRLFGPVGLDLDASASVRVARGLSVDVGASLALVRDQRHLRRGAATPEEILLRLRELETGYRYYTTFGFSFTFGSRSLGAVNPRLGR